MPEAAEVERIVGQLHDVLIHRNLISVEYLGDSSFIKRVKGTDFWKDIKQLKLMEVSRRGKMIWFDFEDYFIVCSLGMTGSFRLVNSNNDPVLNSRKVKKHDRFAFCLSDGDGNEDFLVYNDPRKFGYIHFMTAEDFNKKLRQFGPDLFEITEDEALSISNEIKTKNLIKVSVKLLWTNISLQVSAII